ncbi:hypothetical protein CP533_2903 [Ophiocordyceps camponoti-saundersi (nom. inval.)]|nr:hypothetical protein CP533_2903 [Ophiocordyceps camponoti-saundersi (nom. inval.)]
MKWLVSLGCFVCQFLNNQLVRYAKGVDCMSELSTKHERFAHRCDPIRRGPTGAVIIACLGTGCEAHSCLPSWLQYQRVATHRAPAHHVCAITWGGRR